MEPRFGHDFSQVRVHTDAHAASSARAVDALAYTVREHIAFATGQYAPESNEGRRLLAHELTHVVQQDQVPERSLQRKLPQDPEPDELEREADEKAKLEPAHAHVSGRKPKRKKPAKPGKKSRESKLTFEQVKSLVEANNASNQPTERIVCLIWKESDFKPTERTRPPNTATGLMQVNKPTVQDFNRSQPKGVHCDFSKMTDPAQNIRCGSLILQAKIDQAKGDNTKGLNNYGTGSGYADNILECESCLKAKQETEQACLEKIHA
jgi:hypothetical protein